MPGYRLLICHLLKAVKRLVLVTCTIAPGYTAITDQPAQPLTIITQPSDQTDCYGNTVEFSVEVSGASGAVSYQWQSRPPGGNFTDVPGANSPTAAIHDIGVNGQNINGTEYRVIIMDDSETITSVPALLSINTITGLSGSVNLTICSGGNTAYEVQTYGSVVGYQWSFNDGTGWNPVSDGGAFSGTTSSRLTISNASVAESGSYRVSVTFNTLNQPAGYPVCIITSHTRIRNLTVLPPPSTSVIYHLSLNIIMLSPPRQAKLTGHWGQDN